MQFSLLRVIFSGRKKFATGGGLKVSKVHWEERVTYTCQAICIKSVKNGTVCEERIPASLQLLPVMTYIE